MSDQSAVVAEIEGGVPRFRDAYERLKAEIEAVPLTAANGEIIISSERYTSRTSAANGVASVKANAADDGRYERREARDGSLYFVLKALNGEIVAVSEMYKSSAACEAGVASVKANAGLAVVEG